MRCKISFVPPLDAIRECSPFRHACIGFDLELGRFPEPCHPITCSFDWHPQQATFPRPHTIHVHNISQFNPPPSDWLLEDEIHRTRSVVRVRSSESTRSCLMPRVWISQRFVPLPRRFLSTLS